MILGKSLKYAMGFFFQFGKMGVKTKSNFFKQMLVNIVLKTVQILVIISFYCTWLIKDGHKSFATAPIKRWGLLPPPHELQTGLVTCYDQWSVCVVIVAPLCSVAQLCRLFATPRTVACQVPLSMGFSRQEHWSGLPFPFPGDLCNPGIKPESPASQADALPLCHVVEESCGVNLAMSC